MLLSMFDVLFLLYFFFFFKQKTAYEMRISDWSSDVCSSDLSGLVDSRPDSPLAGASCRGRRGVPQDPAAKLDLAFRPASVRNLAGAGRYRALQRGGAAAQP